MPKRSPKMLQLHRLLREQLLEALVAPMRRSRRARRVDDLAARQGPPVPPDHCTAEGRILVSSPRHCLSHGWTTRVRVEHGGSPVASATHGVASPRRSVMKTDAGTGLLFISPLGVHMRYVIRLHFPASNNMVEYEAL